MSNELSLKEDELFVKFSKEITMAFKLTPTDPWPTPLSMLEYLASVSVSKLATDGNVRIRHKVERRKSKYSMTVPASVVGDQDRMLHALGILVLLREDVVTPAMYLASFDEFDGTLVSVVEDMSMLTFSYEEMSIIAQGFAADMGNLMLLRSIISRKV